MRLAYEAINKAGKAVTGVIDAEDAVAAAETLRQQGLLVTATSEASEVAAAAPRRRNRAANLKTLAIFTRQLHVLISTGTPLAQALDALQRQITDATLRDILADIRTRVEEGASLSRAMEEHPRYFSSVYRSLITAGESSGQLAAMLERLASLVRKQLHVKSSVIGALVYPILLLSVASSVLVVMFTFVLPRFAELFESLNVALPPTTKLMMVISYVFRTYWWALLGGLIAGAVGFKFWLGTAAGKQAWDTLVLRLPVIRGITRNFATARITRLLGVLLESNVPLLEALQLTGQSVSNAHYRNLVAIAEDNVTQGEPVSAAFEDERLIAPSICEAVRHGEQSGKLGALLLMMSDFLDEENDTLIRSLTSILEPIILIGLGGVVAFVALSIFVPLFDLTATVSSGG